VRAVSAPRITPGSRRDIGVINAVIARVAGLVTRTGPNHLFGTLGRHPRLFRRWLRFAGSLMPGGKLPRRDTELVILRVSANCSCEYERRHHVRMGRRAGLSEAEIALVTRRDAPANWPPREAVVLRATDELHDDRVISDATWASLRDHLSDKELIELCLLVGHYEMLAMTINSLGVQPEAT